ncbi:hypothetical protein CTAYLR_001748 [Chrysophaeum taylorii]|uniref:FYVE-type domain-containing protein n=1 Tax=Chrysophaeum taylorii TaxID=2483200 RepID=A0AAD7UFH3_9STRA|nr:hypothetical protein CTAYLR_001748 [Chrysophaeum taylorii]
MSHFLHLSQQLRDHHEGPSDDEPRTEVCRLCRKDAPPLRCRDCNGRQCRACTPHAGAEAEEGVCRECDFARAQHDLAVERQRNENAKRIEPVARRVWRDDTPACSGCGHIFSLSVRRHHCRGCGRCFGSACKGKCVHKRHLNDGTLQYVCQDCTSAQLPPKPKIKKIGNATQKRVGILGF